MKSGLSDIDISAINYIIKKYLVYAVFLLIFWIICAILVFFLKSIAPLLICSGLSIWFYTKIKRKARHSFMWQFAKDNGYKFEEKSSEEESLPSYLETGKNRKIEDVVSGEYLNCPIKFFNFSCDDPNPNKERDISFTVCSIRCKTNLPRIFLDSRAHSLLENNFFKKSKTERFISLEGDFDKYFTLYIPKGYEIEALTIFAPNVMAILIDKSKLFNLELMGDHINIYSFKRIETNEELNSLLNLAKILVVKLAPALERLKK